VWGLLRKKIHSSSYLNLRRHRREEALDRLRERTVEAEHSMNLPGGLESGNKER
jgi:hypothetical protein